MKINKCARGDIIGIAVLKRNLRSRGINVSAIRTTAGAKGAGARMRAGTGAEKIIVQNRIETIGSGRRS